MSTFKCKRCNVEISLEKRGHMCKGTRSTHGRAQDSYVAYQPNYAKSNRQSAQPEYMKRFGSKPKPEVIIE